MLDVQIPYRLEPTLNSRSDLARIVGTAIGNTNGLQVYALRDTSGTTGWTTAPLYIQQLVDSTGMGYVKFGGSNTQQAIGLGAGGSDRLTILSNGNVAMGSFATYLGWGIGTADTTGFYTPSTNVLQLLTGANPRLTILSNGNVGIGTVNPIRLLDISGGTARITGSSGYGSLQIHTPSENVMFFADSNVALGTFTGYLMGQSISYSTGSSFVIGRVNAGTVVTPPAFNIASNGNVGIGTSNPADSRLEVIVSSANDNNVFKLGETANNLRMTAGSSYGAIRYTDSAGTTRGAGMYFNTTGIGIGTPTPSNAILHVTSNATGVSTTGGYFFNTGTTSLQPNSGSTTQNFSIYGANYFWSAVGFIASSDERIKKNFMDISDGQALSDLRLIEPVTYEYVDVVERGSNRVYGFSAQQVSNVLPYAVSKTPEVIPDIYDLADVCGTLVTLRNKTFEYTDISATVNLILRETGKKDVSANFQPPNQIVLHESLGTDISDVFVYGRRVNDFHTLDKNAIFTVNVAATQELDRQLQAAKQKINVLEDALSNVITRLSALEQPAA
jgi:hypothetical protein